MHPSEWRVRKAKRSWRVRLVTSVTSRLPPTSSMRSLHKLGPVFPPHMASIGVYRHRCCCGCCCCCCCVCSSQAQHKHNKPDYEIRNWQTLRASGHWCHSVTESSVFPRLCLCFTLIIPLFSYTYFHSHVVHVYINDPSFGIPQQSQQGRLFTTPLLVKRKYASVGACIKGSFIWLLAKMVLNVCCL